MSASGSRSSRNESLKAIRGGRLLAVSGTDGKALADYELKSPPVFDGMAAAQGQLYLSTKMGKSSAWALSGKGPPEMPFCLSSRSSLDRRGGIAQRPVG